MHYYDDDVCQLTFFDIPMNRIIDRRGRWLLLLLLMLGRLHPVGSSSTFIARRVHSIQIMRMMVVVVKLALSSVGRGVVVVVVGSSGSIDWWWRSNHRRPHHKKYLSSSTTTSTFCFEL